MIYAKETCRFPVFRPEMYRLFPILEDIFQKWGWDCVVTSFNDSMHKDNSAHYDNLAMDIRTKHITEPGVKSAIVEEIRDTLGPKYIVIFEYPGEAQEHIHIQYRRLIGTDQLA